MIVKTSILQLLYQLLNKLQLMSASLEKSVNENCFYSLYLLDI